MNYLKGAAWAALGLALLYTSVLVVLLNFGPGSKHEIQQRVRYDLIDPDSALFRDVVLGQFAACGYVNAKNRLGGYIGWRRFMIDRWTVSAPSPHFVFTDFENEPLLSDFFDERWDRECAESDRSWREQAHRSFDLWRFRKEVL